MECCTYTFVSKSIQQIIMSDILSPHAVATHCYHCGDECGHDHPKKEDKDFCCQGCLVVYDILSSNGMDEYYQYESRPGISKKKVSQKSYDYLDEPEVIEKLLEFNEGSTGKISFTLPQIHCSSCIWLLENIQKLHPGIIHSRVNFVQKKAVISFRTDKITLKELVQLLGSIGYDPELNLEKLHENKSFGPDRSLYYKMGLAGFSFGNIMLLSFPEYLGFVQEDVSKYIGYINILLSIPVLTYSGFDYLRAAYWTVKFKKINIDIPIAVGILALFGRSVYDILSGSGEGYLDSLAGFVFFMLIGKWFQNYTFQSISFDRNYKSYFPISTLIKTNDGWKSSSLDKVEPGHIIMIKNEEIIPVDAYVMDGLAHLDYSFVTGESEIIHKSKGEKIFAGAKHTGGTIQVQAIKRVNQSYLTSLWDEQNFSPERKNNHHKMIENIGRYFTIITMTIAVLTLIYWLYADPSIAFNSFTAVLIVACPCALSLATPFTYGNILRLLGKKQCYLKNVEVIENIQNVNHIVFDKTGTITDHDKLQLSWVGPPLSQVDSYCIKSVAFQSNHPLSRSIFAMIPGPYQEKVVDFEEFVGKGTLAVVDQKNIRIGSEMFVFNTQNKNHKKGVFIVIDDQFIGYFAVHNHLREGVSTLFDTLAKNHKISILSGDNDSEKERLQSLFPGIQDMYFDQSPKDKLQKIKELQEEGQNVMMIGDGLNDAGALKQSQTGLVISNDSNNFTPACDGIIGASAFKDLLKILTFIKGSKKLIIAAFILALAYNTIGLGFAVQGLLSPVIAAILMPVSSITVMLFGVLSSTFLFKKHFS